MENSLITRVFEKYYKAIVSSLPMKNKTFLAELKIQSLLSDHTESALQSFNTSKEMALYFVDNVIKSDLREGINSSFDKLLSVMLECSRNHVKELATGILSELPVERNKTSLGMFH